MTATFLHSSKDETTLPRPLGDYLLVAQLGDDPLGSVYRALHSADEKRFVRLRILQSGELSPRLVASIVEKLEALGPALAHDGIVRRPQFGILNEIPYMAWYETAGWTLDRVLAMARAAKAPVTTEYALLLGERMIDAMEAATRFLDRDLVPHGALWPGFVSISNDAEVRIAGFGLAPAILPAIKKPRGSREIAPYIAPEARDRKRAALNSDVYSLGIMLLELLTGRRPALGAPLPELRSGDPFSQEIGTFLKTALAPPEERFQTISDMRRALQETMRAAPRLLYPAGLAFYLYKLLNPESTGVPQADADATNPVESEPRLAGGVGEPAPVEGDDDLLVEMSRAMESHNREPEPFDLSPSELAQAVGEEASVDDEPRGDVAGGASAVPEFPLVPFSGDPAMLTDPALLEAARVRRPVRGGGTAALLIVAGCVFGLALLIDTERARRVAAVVPSPSPIPAASASAAPPELPPFAAAEPPAPEGYPTHALIAPEPAAPPQLPVAHAATSRVSRERRQEQEGARRGAEDVRFQAGLARIAAERLEGREIAPARYQEASDREREAESLYRRGQFDAARDAFEDAARIYREVESTSHEERVKRVRLSPAP
ncbi:MAG TPA: protein kinase [Thermoanaerobaculia bacterium]|nr:protein kinase [Thermoanaerobaculia bacterium]